MKLMKHNKSYSFLHSFLIFSLTTFSYNQKYLLEYLTIHLNDETLFSLIIPYAYGDQHLPLGMNYN